MFQEMFRYYTEGHGLAGNGGRKAVGLDDLSGLFQPWQVYDSKMTLDNSFAK